MKEINLLVLILIISTTQNFGQEVKCYCYKNDAPFLLSAQKGADKVVEWIVTKGDSAAVISYMDKSCQQSWSFFNEKFREHKEKNRIYFVKQEKDSISFTKEFRFDAKGSAMSQKYAYNARVYPDSLVVHIGYPSSKNSMSNFNDTFGPPDRTYLRVLEE